MSAAARNACQHTPEQSLHMNEEYTVPPRLHGAGGAINIVAAMTVLALVACGSTAGNITTPTTMQVRSSADACSAMTGSHIPASAIALATQGAIVTSASLIAADRATGLPSFCKVLGKVLASNRADPAITFEVNLPTTWNLKALQLGGSGFDGLLVSGLGGLIGGVPNWPSDEQQPISMNYVTFGSDAGTTVDGAFGLNAQALANYGGESVKRTHDAALYLIKAFYNTAPHRMYHIGGSKGGHESLVAAQRYGNDYDGIVAYYPANQNQAMVLSWLRMWSTAYSSREGALNPAKQALVKTKVLEVCDGLDGVKDGIVSNTAACQAKFSIDNLRCSGGGDAGDTCLSDAQIKTLMTAATPMKFAFPLTNGVTSIGPYPVFQGADVAGILFDPVGIEGTRTAYFNSFNPVVKYFIEQNPNGTSIGFDYRAWQPRVMQLSRLLDATDPNLDTFQRRGGKLLLVQGTTDMLVPPAQTTTYYKQVATRYGELVKSFVRYYVQPGFGHANGTFALQWDSLTALDVWVESGQAPINPVVKDGNGATKGRTRPLCEYPQFPKYTGNGDADSASSFVCVDD
ncbi:tannase/feruloyl esterase family alpha/beta hydrolase [Burkholderia cepacia]|nr:tannase/feruloyl esterase family alpha/beta hydrolase [Burkholderia cenocepacia]RQZ91048.1 tannase/feruloyl esterase family alpha/beta hydrolase [Burkholderia cepacia]RQV30329.1 tannase/feruloyl esterase family alpha/beta hydrolase [Burkholderia cenocepacia]RQV88842.1 tannase/feruloyl esterase family alpha/beta hydrolase [Burkholderia cenocepacia]RQZ98419.1 tannase/feruloyl esterase family alpha/beta hydrolase [Burkholderia cenocepacia]